MRLLVLGGTKFVGRHLVEEALRLGHDVTLFNRGRTNPALFSDVERVIGDRDGDLSGLERGEWDAVVDTCGYVPRVVRASAELLAGKVGHYTFVSSGSVYDIRAMNYDENSAVETVEDESTEDVDAHYGALKALCERAAEQAMPGRVLSVRAGLIVGPHDPTGRFTYWVHRIARGGDVLAPEPRDQAVQFVDVRDMAAWMLDMTEARRAGVYNATGPERPLTMEEFLEDCRRALLSEARFVWVEEEFLLERGVEFWSDLPLWLAPTTHPEHAAFLTMNIEKARAAGLRFRPLADTVRATHSHAQPTEDAGLAPERERQLLADWRQRQGASHR